ncbi:MAG: SDR family NAD(P)-dependent oxidoreductase [Candidatus Margulisbacteria bacterium]|nr:SDR family NAD(P)-dependent oxidoreductase [Candidatus Margulisiibacteriota bacterium]
MNNIGIILASGLGLRYKSSIPKQFAKQNGKPVFMYVYDEMVKSGLFNKIVITIPSKKYQYLIPKKAISIIGGKTRNKTIYNVLQEIKKFKPTNVLFHDAVRPLIKAKDFNLYIEALKKRVAVITVEKITDSLYPSINRENYQLVQTPEAFNYQCLCKYFKADRYFTAIYQHIQTEPHLIYLNHPNYKITYPYDLFMMEQLTKYTPLQLCKPDLVGHRILVLGSKGGIGKALMKELKKYKCEVDEYTEDLRKEFYFTGYDIIINVSGVAYSDKDGVVENYDEIMDVNLKVNIRLLEGIKEAGNRPINVVLISSSSATKGRPNLTAYSASKVALHSIIESKAEELAKEGIYVNCICPEKVNTLLSKKLHGDCKPEETLTPEEVAKAILSYADVNFGGKIVHLRKGMV